MEEYFPLTSQFSSSNIRLERVTAEKEKQNLISVACWGQNHFFAKKCLDVSQAIAAHAVTSEFVSCLLAYWNMCKVKQNISLVAIETSWTFFRKLKRLIMIISTTNKLNLHIHVHRSVECNCNINAHSVCLDRNCSKFLLR